jgi:tellurite resistance protein TehA-like permease
MSVQGLVAFFCAALALVMLSFPIWGPRYFNNHISRPGGKRPTIWLIVSLEAILAAGIIEIAEDSFWSEKDLPLVLPCLGMLLVVGGFSGAFWAVSNYPIYHGMDDIGGADNTIELLASESA